jgi:superfamily I DNA/RNA helicase
MANSALAFYTVSSPFASSDSTVRRSCGMKTLGNVIPTPEQALVIDDDAPGYWLIRGAAGSGKTTTALLRLKFLVRYWRDRREDLGLAGPVRVLVLTFNRTLRGYINELARQQIQSGPEVDLEVSTFAAWAQGLLGQVLLEHQPREARLRSLAGGDFQWRSDFLAGEVDYVLGRWLPDDRAQYLTAERTGRGAAPRVDRPLRERLIEQVIEPYTSWKLSAGVLDWSDLAVEMALRKVTAPYDVVVVDETQDFSANQVRAIVNHVADEFVCTFVRDTTQRIYPNFFVWRDVGVDFGAQGRRSRRLSRNYRNTRQIAAFARPLVEGIEVLEDEALPDFQHCTGDGPMPYVLHGRYSQQLDWTIDYLRSGAIEDEDSIAFLHPKGGNWFRELRHRLDAERIPWTSITREAEWPEGDEQVALSTMHSAKGLEFDHVIILGYNAEVVQHGEEDHDSLLDTQRRLLAMAVGRARKSVVVGYKPSDTSRLVEFLDPDTYESVDL